MAYGGLYNTAASTLNVEANTPSQLALPSTMPSLDVTYGTNTITLADEGDYEIHYAIAASAPAGTTLTLAVRQGGTNIPQATTVRALIADTSTSFAGTTIVTLPAGTVLDVAVSTPTPATVTIGSGAALTVKKLDA